jgi:hypothetical protein
MPSNVRCSISVSTSAAAAPAKARAIARTTRAVNAAVIARRARV